MWDAELTSFPRIVALRSVRLNRYSKRGGTPEDAEKEKSWSAPGLSHWSSIPLAFEAFSMAV